MGNGHLRAEKMEWLWFYHTLLPSLIRQCSQLSRWSHCCQLCSPAAVAQLGQLRIACRVRQGLKKSNTPCDRLKGLFLTSCYLACVTHGISSSQDSSDSSVASSAKISHRAMKTSRSSMGSPPDLHWDLCIAIAGQQRQTSISLSTNGDQR